MSGSRLLEMNPCTTPQLIPHTSAKPLWLSNHLCGYLASLLPGQTLSFPYHGGILQIPNPRAMKLVTTRERPSAVKHCIYTMIIRNGT